jgi:hypothetical protein
MWCWDMNVSEEKTQVIYIPKRLEVPDDVLQLNGGYIPFLNNAGE